MLFGGYRCNKDPPLPANKIFFSWRMEKISWTDRVGNEEVLNVEYTIKRRKAKWIGHILRRNCHLKHVTEGKKEGRIAVAGRRERRNKMASKTARDTRNCMRTQQMAICGWVAVEEPMDLAWDRQGFERSSIKTLNKNWRMYITNIKNDFLHGVEFYFRSFFLSFFLS